VEDLLLTLLYLFLVHSEVYPLVVEELGGRMEGRAEVLQEELRRASLPMLPGNRGQADLNHIWDPVDASLGHHTSEVHILEDSEEVGTEVGEDDEEEDIEEDIEHEEEEGPWPPSFVPLSRACHAFPSHAFHVLCLPTPFVSWHTNHEWPGLALALRRHAYLQ
jgi:hypothetical protein